MDASMGHCAPIFRPFRAIFVLFATAIFIIAHASSPCAAAQNYSKPSSIQFQAPANSPLLPAPIVAEDLWPDLSPDPQLPSIAPTGFTPLYSVQDWQEYLKQFAGPNTGPSVADENSAIALAGKMLTASQNATSIGLARLLAIRAFALTYQSSIGSPVAQQALARYMQLVINPNDPVQTAPLWTMSHLLAYLRATPVPARQQYAMLAERADVQLTMDLLVNGQLDAAGQVVRMLVIHETRAVRANTQLMAQMDMARTLVTQTDQMISDLDVDYAKMFQGDADASEPIYLYTRFVRDIPELRSAILQRWPTGAMAILDDALEGSGANIEDRYNAAQFLSQAAAKLPEGVLRDRTMYAALENYRAYLSDPSTQSERIKRTLAHLAIEQFHQQGARPQPVVTVLQGLIGPPAASQTVAPSKNSSHQAQP
jgi:hypothetical protein